MSHALAAAFLRKIDQLNAHGRQVRALIKKVQGGSIAAARKLAFKQTHEPYVRTELISEGFSLIRSLRKVSPEIKIIRPLSLRKELNAHSEKVNELSHCASRGGSQKAAHELMEGLIVHANLERTVLEAIITEVTAHLDAGKYPC